MKKYFILALMATTFVACGKKELESAEETLIEFREEKNKDVNFIIFNDKLKGSKGNDAPQNQGSGNSNQNTQQ